MKKEQELINYHKKYQEKTEYDTAYNEYKDKFEKLRDIDNATQSDFKEIALDFANAWGSRTKTTPHIAKKAILNLKKHRKIFKILLSLDLQSIDLDKYENGIKTIYNCLEKINPTARSKILHMLNERLFPIWDSQIRNLYGVKANASGYFVYTLLNKRQIKKIQIEKVEEATSRPILKILDECNWYQTHKK